MEEAVTSPEHTNDIVPDTLLFARIAAGDEGAFALFYRQMVPQLRPFIYSITHADLLVEEVIQEAFLRCWLNRDKLPGLSNPRAWLFRITGNICYSLFQRSLVEKKAMDVVGTQATGPDTGTTDLIQVKFLKAALQEAIQQLSPQRKKIYLLNREQGFTADEIAAQLGLSVQTVRNTLTASLEFLRSRLAKQGYTISISILSLLIFKW
jgi:RNA polymerase sigma-70 factor (ECF subfamily)